MFKVSFNASDVILPKPIKFNGKDIVPANPIKTFNGEKIVWRHRHELGAATTEDVNIPVASEVPKESFNEFCPIGDSHSPSHQS